MNRRQLLKSATLASVWPALASTGRKRIATIITEYRYNSHADVIVGRLLEGYDYAGRRIAPRTRVVSMYTDQVPSNDMSRAISTPKASTRSDGSDTDTPVPSRRRVSRRRMSSSWL